MCNKFDHQIQKSRKLRIGDMLHIVSYTTFVSLFIGIKIVARLLRYSKFTAFVKPCNLPLNNLPSNHCLMNKVTLTESLLLTIFMIQSLPEQLTFIHLVKRFSALWVVESSSRCSQESATGFI
jgi:hypothetical protein